MSRRGRDERGSGLITSTIGTFLVLATMFLSVELLVTIHRRTMVTGLASDLARRLARDPTLNADHEAAAMASDLGPGVRVVTSDDGDDIVVTVSARGPAIAPLRAIAPFARIERTARSHREAFVTEEP